MENTELIAKLRSAGGDGDAIHCWNMCVKAAVALEAAQAEVAHLHRVVEQHNADAMKWFNEHKAVLEKLSELEKQEPVADCWINKYGAIWEINARKTIGESLGLKPACLYLAAGGKEK